MTTPAIRIENVSKLYRLGTVGTGTMAHDLNRWWHAIRGKEDPYAKVGQVNKRDQAADSEYVWALKDVNLDVNQGEVLGIIGANGAGKSTLLKIISRITSPTTGTIKAKGRIASLLEVGTGMNEEMTARENIFLNGSILGMRRHEISRNFGDIIDFAGCAMYVDTPVKRYSSGMRVRLGFAVAAFLEPEILIVDEVLAVGDAEFQKRAIGKMEEISKGGKRTVLFVSHSMASISRLCARVVRMANGSIAQDGNAEQVIEAHLLGVNNIPLGQPIPKDIARGGTGAFRVNRVWLENTDQSPKTVVRSGDDLVIAMQFVPTSNNQIRSGVASIGLLDREDRYVLLVRSSFSRENVSLNGTTTIRCHIRDLNLAQGSFRGIVFLSDRDNEVVDVVKDAFAIDVSPGDYFKTGEVGLPEQCKILTRASWTTSSQI